MILNVLPSLPKPSPWIGHKGGPCGSERRQQSIAAPVKMVLASKMRLAFRKAESDIEGCLLSLKSSKTTPGATRRKNIATVATSPGGIVASQTAFSSSLYIEGGLSVASGGDVEIESIFNWWSDCSIRSSSMGTAETGLSVLLRGRPRGVSSQAPELRERKIGITPFDCPRDNVIQYKL
jgi:hypothetical protein